MRKKQNNGIKWIRHNEGEKILPVCMLCRGPVTRWNSVKHRGSHWHKNCIARGEGGAG